MRIARLIAAISTAVVASVLSPRASWSRIVAAWRLLFKTYERAAFWTVYRRYRCCNKCELFYKPLRTCGTPLKKDFRGLGCYCDQQVKCGIKAATCWADDNLGDDCKFGWKSRQKGETVP